LPIVLPFLSFLAVYIAVLCIEETQKLINKRLKRQKMAIQTATNDKNSITNANKRQYKQ